MPDQVSSLRVAVQVEGWAELNRLNNTFAQLRTEAEARPAAIRARRSTAGAERQALTFGEQAGEALGANVIAPTLKAPFAMVRNAAGQATTVVTSMVGPLGKLAVSGVAGAATAGAAVIAIGAIAIPLFNLAATIRILRTSFRWAKDASDDQLRVLSRTKKTFPGITGDALRAAEAQTSIKLKLAGVLFGEGADALAEQVTRRFTDVRMGKGLRGERDIFFRWGITPAAVQTFERARGGERIDLTDWLALFIRKREELDARQAATREGSAQWRSIVAKRAMLYDDSLKLFGQRFSTILGTWGTFDLARLRQNLMKAAPLGAAGPGVDADQRARDFNIQLATTQTIFTQLKKGIAGDVQPTLTTMMDGLTNWLADSEQGGKGMGRAFRNLASALAINAWETMEALVQGVEPGDVTRFIEEIRDKWQPEKTVSTLVGAVPVIIGLAEVINTLFKFVSGRWGPEWLRRRVRGEAYFAPKEVAAPGAPTFAERWAGEAAGAPVTRTGYMGGGGPGGGSAGGAPTFTPQQQAAQRALAVVGGSPPRYGTPEYRQWSQTPEFQQWTQQSPEYQKWQRQAQMPAGGRGLGPARFTRPGPGAAPAPVAPPPAMRPEGMPPGMTQQHLAGAAQAALSSGYAGAAAYTKKHFGYVPSAWCGAFAASVVKSNGLEPPKNPQVAGNWKNWGEAVTGAPQPGDVVVVKGRSPRTGVEGRHVTFVESYDPKTGMISTVGGNEGYERGARPKRHISGVYVRRMPTAVAGQPGAEPTTGSGPEPTATPRPITAAGGAFGGAGATGVIPPTAAQAPTPTVPGPAPAPAAVPPGPREYGPAKHAGLAQYEGHIQKAAAETGLSPLHIRSMVLIESNARPGTQTGKYKGLLQLDDAQFRKFGGRGSIFDPEQNIMAGARKIKEAQGQFESNIGRKAEPWEHYMAHQQGAWGAAAHVKTPNIPAWQSFQRASKWADAKAKRAIYGNLTPDAKARFQAKYGSDWASKVTSAEFMQEWKGRYSLKEAEAGAKGTTEATQTALQALPPPEPAAAAAATPTPPGVRAGQIDTSKMPFKATGGELARHGPEGSWHKLDPDFRRRLQAMAGDMPESVKKEVAITSGWRSDELQKQLYLAAKDKSKVALPVSMGGRGSRHLRGTAVDLASVMGMKDFGKSGAYKWMMENKEKYGLSHLGQSDAPGTWEPWHWQVSSRAKPLAPGVGLPKEPTPPTEELAPPVTVAAPLEDRTGVLRTRQQKALADAAEEQAKKEVEAGRPPPMRVIRSAAAGEEERKKEEADTKETLTRREEKKKALTEKPPQRKDALEEGKAAGEAAAKSFKEGIKDTKIPIKPLKSEETEREEKRDESQQKEAA